MDKFKFKKDREKLSDQEISQQMNFDKFISGYTPIKSWFSKLTQFNSLIVSTAVVLVAAGYLIFRPAKTESIVAIKPFVDPPVQTMDLVSTVFACNNQADTTLVYKTGTIIHVPESAFTDENGNDVKGPVEVRFREFHDPVDIILSGIPMHYDSAGEHYQLESAGMFEVLAFQRGQALQLKPGKEITVNMVSHTNNGNDYNIYYLDTTKRQWNYISENTEKNNTCKPLFERNPAYAKEFEANDKFESMNNPVLPKKGDPRAYNFTIDFKRSEFPELAVYNGLKFEPIENKKKFHSSLARKTWDDVVIARESDRGYVITFYAEKDSHSIKVVPVVDEKNYAETMKDFEKRQRQYIAYLSEKKKYAKEKRDSLYRIRSAYSLVALRSNLNERFNNFIDDSFTETSRDLLVYRTFGVTRLGIWNSDQLFAFFSGPAVFNHKAVFTSVKNQQLMLKSVLLVQRNFNSTYTVLESNFDQFPFEYKIDVVIGIGYNNELYYLKDEELKQVDAGKNTLLFKMKQLEGIIGSADLKKLLKI